MKSIQDTTVNFDFEAALEKVVSGERARELKRAKTMQQVQEFKARLEERKKSLMWCLLEDRKKVDFDLVLEDGYIGECHAAVLEMIHENPTMLPFVSILTKEPVQPTDDSPWHSKQIAQVPPTAFQASDAAAQDSFLYYVRFHYDVSSEKNE